MAVNQAALYHNGTIITVNQTRDVILAGSMLVIGNRIVAIGKTGVPVCMPEGTKMIDLESNIVIPGLVNAHAHMVQSLMRGLAEDMDLFRWACDAIWPLEVSFKGDDGYVATKLAMAEMLKSGTT
jgi:cytosine/adenosine deaminase-related metal-dependent hydrolase